MCRITKNREKNMKFPINIVFIFGSYAYDDFITYDGGVDYLRNLAEKLASKGHNVFVITSGKQDSNLNIPININRVKVFPTIYEWGLKGLINGEYKRLSKLIKKINPHVITIIYPDTRLKNKYIIPLLIKLIEPNVPIITTIFHFFPKGANIFYVFATLLLYLMSTKLHFHDEGFKEIFDKLFFPLRKKSFFIPVGCNIEVPNNLEMTKKNKTILKEMLGLDSAIRYISFFGYWYPSKGVDLLIKALNILVLKGMNLKLLLIGGHSIKDMNKYEKSIFDMIYELDLQDKVIITGYLLDDTEIVNYMLCSEVCVFPFRNNAIGRSSITLPILLGIPIITTRLVKKSNFLINKETALLVRPNDFEELSKAIEEILENEKLKNYLSKNISRISIRMDWNNIANEWINIFSQVIKFS